MLKVVELGLYRHRSDEDRRMLVTELKKEIVERNRMEKELEMRVRQQDVIAHLGHNALLSINPVEFMNEIVNKIAETLDNEYCKVLKLLPDDMNMLPLSKCWMAKDGHGRTYQNPSSIGYTGRLHIEFKQTGYRK